MKTCTKCGLTKELVFFSRKKDSKDGRTTRCKKCQFVDNQARYYRRRERNVCMKCGRQKKNQKDICSYCASYYTPTPSSDCNQTILEITKLYPIGYMDVYELLKTYTKSEILAGEYINGVFTPADLFKKEYLKKNIY